MTSFYNPPLFLWYIYSLFILTPANGILTCDIINIILFLGKDKPGKFERWFKTKCPDMARKGRTIVNVLKEMKFNTPDTCEKAMLYVIDELDLRCCFDGFEYYQPQ